MTRVGVFDTPGLSSLVEVLDAAAGWCEPVIVNAQGRSWRDAELAALESAAHLDATRLSSTELLNELTARLLDGVATFSDDLVPVVAWAAARLGLPYHDEATATALTRKDIQRRQLASAGLDQPRAALLNDEHDVAAAARHVGFPAVLKPTHGTGSAGVFPIDDLAGLRASLRSASDLPLAETGSEAFTFDRSLPWQLEERLPAGRHPAADWLSDYVSVETAALGHGDYWHFWITDRLPLTWPFRETGAVAPTLLPPEAQEEVRALASRALSALGVRTGLIHTEIKMTPGGPRVIEVNGRLGGFVGQIVARLSDLDPTRMALEAAAGKLAPRPVAVAAAFEAMYLVHPPAWARVVTRLPDPAELRRIPGVWRVDTRLRPGDPVDYRTGTVGRMQTVWVRAGELSELAASCRRVAEFVGAHARYEPAEPKVR